MFYKAIYCNRARIINPNTACPLVLKEAATDEGFLVVPDPVPPPLC